MEQSLGRLFVRVARLHYNAVQVAYAEHGVHPGQAGVLFFLHEEDGQTQRQLGERLLTSPPTITSILQRMEKGELILRRQDPKDLRSHRVFLCDKGRVLIPKLKEVLHQLEEETFGGFTLEEKVLLRRFFLQMKENLMKRGQEEDNGTLV